MGVRGSDDDEAEDYARIDREALELLKGVEGIPLTVRFTPASMPGVLQSDAPAKQPAFQPGERILTAEVGEDRGRELEELNRKPGRLANLDLRGL